MFAIRDLSIRKKLTLIVMVTSATAVLLATLSFYTLFVKNYRQAYRHDLVSLAAVLGHNCQAALAFHIPEDAEKVLSSLRARPSIVYADVHDNEANLFATYSTNQASALSRPTLDETIHPPLEGTLPASYLKIGRDITLDANILGTITLYDDMRHIEAARRLAAIILVTVMVIVLSIAYLLASKLQGLISRPVLDLAAVSRRISESRDYSLRARKRSSDELGRLVESFNDMLSQIERRDKALRGSEERFHTLVDQAVDAFFLHDMDGRLIDVNQQACDSLGYSRDELLALRISDLEGRPDTGENQEDVWDNLPAEPVTIEVDHRRKDGTVFPVEVRLGMLELDNQTFIMRLARDVTDRQQLQEQFLHAQKMEAIGRLSGGVAHDFNNLLSAILGYSELILMDMPDDSPVKENVEAIYAAGKRATGLVRQLLAFSRKQVLEIKATNLNTVVNDLLKLLGRLIGEDIELVFHAQSQVGIILADSIQVEQVLMNLAVNARDAMPRGGRLIIETQDVYLDEEYARHHPDVKPGPYVMLAVTDTGIGMTKEVQEKIFEPFFTTKVEGKGTGLGLATIYGIIRQHKGHMHVYSESGKGTTFKIYFPQIEKTVDQKASDKKKRAVPEGMETILVVDDEPSILKLVVDSLQPLGYKLMEAGDGEEALEICKTAGNEIDLLLTDVVMPGMSGRELVDAVKQILPEMKVVFMSGYTDDVVIRQGVLEPGVHYLNKPLVPSELAIKLRNVLDQGK